MWQRRTLQARTILQQTGLDVVRAADGANSPRRPIPGAVRATLGAKRHLASVKLRSCAFVVGIAGSHSSSSSLPWLALRSEHGKGTNAVFRVALAERRRCWACPCGWGAAKESGDSENDEWPGQSGQTSSSTLSIEPAAMSTFDPLHESRTEEQRQRRAKQEPQQLAQQSEPKDTN